MDQSNENRIREFLQQLKRQVDERRTELQYVGPGLTKFDCQLVVTSLGQFLGFKVWGKDEWKTGGPRRAFRVIPGQINPDVDNNKEFPVPYDNEHFGKKDSRADYVWLDESGKCVAVFEIDGMDNNPKDHLPVSAPVKIRHHIRTNNLFSLSKPVWESNYGYVPPVRAWVLFHVGNDLSPKPRRSCTKSAEWWRHHFSKCADLDGATVFRDTEVFGDAMLEYLDVSCPGFQWTLG